MATAYLESLNRLLENLDLARNLNCKIECRHFFSGAALYANDKICASWSPVGLAFKLPDDETTRLISNGEARPLQYFPAGPVKKGYALFENPEQYPKHNWTPYFIKAIEQVR